VNFVELTPHYFPDVIRLANQVHGANYLNSEALLQLQKQGIKLGINASFIALDQQQHVVGYRISLAAAQWPADKWCNQHLWPVPLAKMAYFKSVAICETQRGKGIASKLLHTSIAALKRQGAAAGLAHIWRESPNNAAQRYFSQAGGRLLAIHPERWRHLSETVGYDCPICVNVCLCSAAEMVLTF
jgi:ribosomal protein S18 acetylase RimI-like enzyme